MGWHGHLQLAFRHDTLDGEPRSVLLDRHSGPLRVLRALYPESPQVCHAVLVHPPGGIVGGDSLAVEIDAAARTHALLTTPGAARFYRSAGDAAVQTLHARVAEGARLEWLPLETICHRGALAENRMRFELAPGAEMIGWDMLALGLPASGEAFDRGRYTQQIELPGVWLERGTIDGGDRLLLDSPLGLAGHRVLATAWFAAGEPMSAARIERLLDAARAAAQDSAGHAPSGASSLDDRCIVMRALAPRVEPAMHLLTAVWRAWRETAWAMDACPPRVWRT